MKTKTYCPNVFPQAFRFDKLNLALLTIVTVFLSLNLQPMIANAQETASAAEAQNCPPMPIVANQTIQGSLSDSDCISRSKQVPADRYSFNATAGQLIAITFSSDTFAPYLILFGPGGQILFQSGGSVGQGRARIPQSGFQRLPENGTYTIEATSGTNSSTTLGNYNLLLALGNNNCAYLPTVDTTPYPALGSYGKISISAPAGCAWQITSATPWIRPAGISNGNGDANTTIFVTANNGIAARAGLIHVAGIPYVIPQYGNPRLCSSSGITAGVTVRGALANGDCASAFRVASNGTPLADRYHLRLTAGQRIAATMLSSFAGQLHFIGPDATLFGQSWESGDRYTRFPASGFEFVYTSGDYLIEVTSQNAQQTGDYALMVEVIGGNCRYTVTPQPKILASAGDTGRVTVETNNGCHWHAMSEANWIHFPSGSGGIGGGALNIEAISNPDTTPRRGRIYVAGEFLTFTQLGYNNVASVSASSFLSERLASDSIIASFGIGLATTTHIAESLPLPTNLVGTQIAIRDRNDVVRNAGLFFVSPEQANFLMPSGLADGPALITVTSGDGTMLTGAIEIRRVAPGLFAANADGRGVAAAQALRVKADSSQIYEPVARLDSASGRFVAEPIDFGEESDRLFLVLFGTGWRNRSSLAGVEIKIDGVAVPSLYAGAQGNLLGVDQINLELPRNMAGRGEVEISVKVDGVSANAVKVHFK